MLKNEVRLLSQFVVFCIKFVSGIDCHILKD
jgi:hypothetical protein